MIRVACERPLEMTARRSLETPVTIFCCRCNKRLSREFYATLGFNHLSKQVKTVADRRVLQEKSLFGCEPKTLPYLLCQMNLLLHGLDAPQIDPGNALRHKLTDIGERDRVDVILTNPPFGGEEEKGIQGNFPEDKQTAETALLFLQLIMRKLKRVGTISTSSQTSSS